MGSNRRIEAGTSLVVADHSKWGVIRISSIARLDHVDVLTTDAGLDPDAQAILAKAVRSLVVVESRSPASSPEVSRAH
jgi:DeoR/GlpR family transcriptional regulator of sugar metabolism